MANLIDRFTIQMQLYGASQVSNQLLNVANQINGVQGVVYNASKFSSGLLVMSGLAAVGAISSITKATVETSMQFQSLNRQLSVVFDTAAQGKEAFDWAIKFAQDTPFDLEEVTKAMISLSARGIQPTARNMKAFGGIAKLFGFDMDYIARAIASAGHGRFHSLTFVSGITKSDLPANLWDSSGKAKDYQKVIEAILKIMEKRFPDALEKVSDQLATQASAASDAWKQFEDEAFGEKGLKLLSGWFIASKSMAEGFLALANDIKAAWDLMGMAFNLGLANILSGIQKVLNFFGAGKFLDNTIKYLQNRGDKFADAWIKIMDKYLGKKSPDTDPPSIRNALKKTGGDSLGGAGTSQFLKEVIGGGNFAKRGILPSEMPGLAGRRAQNTVHIRLETSEGTDFRVALEHIIQKGVEGVLRHGALAPA